MNNKENLYFYRIYGLNIASDIYLPELMSIAGGAEINIKYGKVPTEINGVSWNDEYLKVNKNEMILNIEKVAKYYVAYGNKIIVEEYDNADTNLVKSYLLGTVLGTLLLQRNIMLIHGSAVGINGRCVVFTGISGAGKSTLSSALRKMGYSFLADDVSAVTINEQGIPMVHPAYPQQKLWSDSVSLIGDDVSNLSRIYKDEDKYAIPVEKGFLNSALPLFAVVELNVGDGSTVSINKITGTDKLSTLITNIYRIEVLKSFGINADYFKQCVKIAKKIAIYKLIRPKGAFSIEEQIKLIKEQLELIG